jgi:hypothetical protein
MKEILISIVKELDKIKYKKKAEVFVGKDLYLLITDTFYVSKESDFSKEIKIGGYTLKIFKDDTQEYLFKIKV